MFIVFQLEPYWCLRLLRVSTVKVMIKSDYNLKKNIHKISVKMNKRKKKQMEK